MSQCSCDTSMPKAPIAAAPTDPVTPSSTSASASSARAIRSSLSTSLSSPSTGRTANRRAHSCTWTIGDGEVSRLAISASMTCPWLARATSRHGAARSMMPAMSSRRQNHATTGSAPSACSVLAAPYRACIRCLPGVSRNPGSILNHIRIQDRLTRRNG